MDINLLKICGKEEQKGGNVFKTAMNKAFVRTNEDKGIKRDNAKKSKFMKQKGCQIITP